MIQRSLAFELVGIPEGAVLGHVDDVGLPVVGLHLLVDAVGLVVLERQGRFSSALRSPLITPPCLPGAGGALMFYPGGTSLFWNV